MNGRLFKCRNAKRQAGLLACGGLSDGEKEEVQAHLANCPDCRRYYQEMVDMTGRLQAWSQSASPVAFRQSAHARWLRTIQHAKTRVTVERSFPVFEWRRILAGVATVWALTVLFRVTAPDVELGKTKSNSASPRDVLAVLKLPVDFGSPWASDRKLSADTTPSWPESQPADRRPRSDARSKYRMG